VSRFSQLGAWARRSPGTVTLGLVTVGMFGLQALAGGVYDVPAATRLGALLADRVVDEGEYFRLVMPMFLHMGPIHLALNLFAFVQLAWLVEHVWGTLRLLVFYLVCGVGAALVTATFAPLARPTLGASGAIMGLAGVLLGARYMATPALRLFLREVFGRRLFWGVMLTFGIGLLLEAFFPIVDNWGHLGGFVVGLLLAAATPDPDAGEGPVRVVGAALVPVVAGAAAWAAVQGPVALRTLDADLAWQYRLGASRAPNSAHGVGMMFAMMKHYREAGQADEGLAVLERQLQQVEEPMLLLTMASLFLEEGELDDAALVALRRWVEVQPHDATALNSLAWHLVTHDDPEARDPVEAEALVRKALRRVREPDSEAGRSQRAAYLDTLGEALFQLERYDEALAVQAESLELAEELELADLPEIRERHGRIEAAMEE